MSLDGAEVRHKIWPPYLFHVSRSGSSHASMMEVDANTLTGRHFDPGFWRRPHALNLGTGCRRNSSRTTLLKGPLRVGDKKLKGSWCGSSGILYTLIINQIGKARFPPLQVWKLH